ncbi:MAG: HAD family hydrolase [Clostridia bacterium]
MTSISNITNVALMYDFDKTLSTKDMQEYDFIPSLSMTPTQFWTASDQFAKQHKMDHILSTMYLMIDKAKRGNINLSQESLREQGKQIELFPGVLDWFERITNYGLTLGLNVRHYIISSGLKTMIEGTPIAKYFTQIFASDFLYDQQGFPVWPSMAINFTSKTQFLYRIHKGVEDTAEHIKLNRKQDKNEVQVPFSNMIYFGDGFTDVPSMKLTRLNGGYSVGVYQNQDNNYLVADDRVSFYVPADYREGSLLDKTIKAIINRMSADAELAKLGWDKLVD